MTSFNSHTYNFTSLLGRASFPNYHAKRVVVPAFQRPFSWEKSHVSAFWEDVTTFHAQLTKKSAQELYFLGPIVILPEEDQVKLLDGQQRLATVTILLAALRDYARSVGGKEAQDLARDIHRDYLLLDDEETFSLTLGELDDPFFRPAVQDDPPSKPSIRLQSHRLIWQAKTFLGGKLKEHMQTVSAKTVVDELKALKKTLATHMKMVAIQVSSEDEAYLIFETLNDRGLRLGVPDLLLNYLMRMATTDPQKRKVRILWNSVVETLGTRRISTFVRHMWVSHYGDVKSQTLFREIRTTLEDEKIPSVKFASECAEESTLYDAIFDRNADVVPEAAIPAITGLVHDLEADYVLPILLAGLAALSPADFTKLANLVVSLVVRHSVITNRNPNDLENALYQAARDIRKQRQATGKSGSALAAAKSAVAGIDPTDEQVKAALRDVHLAKRQASYVLYTIAERMQSPTKAVTLRKNSIEHIFPESPDKNAWSNQQALAPFVWHLGNLTVLEETYNRDAGGKSFKDKRKFYEKSDLVMSRTVAEKFKAWDVDAIVKRAEAMHSSIILIWPRLQTKA
jgi:Protein of unknown function DUF262/Protein of unknown function (DUF1524)